MARRSGFRTQAPRSGTLVVSVVLWLLGLADVLGAVSLPNNLGVWSLVGAGLLLILGSLVDGL